MNILFYDETGKWFSTSKISIFCKSDVSLAKDAYNEILAHHKRFGRVNFVITFGGRSDGMSYYINLMEKLGLDTSIFKK